MAFLALTNTLLGFADVQKTLSAAVAVFIFNILYEIILSQSLKQYAMCPLIDFINHSSTVQVGWGAGAAATVSLCVWEGGKGRV